MQCSARPRDAVRCYALDRMHGVGMTTVFTRGKEGGRRVAEVPVFSLRMHL